MNASSLYQSNYKNQQHSSRNDDKSTFAVKGLTKMSHNRKLSDYAEELVATYAKFSGDTYNLSLDMIPSEERNELARLYIESTNREVNDCVYGNDFSIEGNYTCALLAMLQNDCPETRQAFAEVTLQNIITYYDKQLNEVLEDACVAYYHLINNEQGLYAQLCNESGEVYWGRF